LWERYFALGHTDYRPELEAALICREMGWTWQEYQSQPAFFIKVVHEMLKAEGYHARQRMNKNG